MIRHYNYDVIDIGHICQGTKNMERMKKTEYCYHFYERLHISSTLRHLLSLSLNGYDVYLRPTPFILE